MQQQQLKHMEKHNGKNGKLQQPEKGLQVKVALEEINNKLMRVKVSSRNLQMSVKLRILQEIKQFFPNQTYHRAKEGGTQSQARWRLPNLLWPQKQGSSLVWANHLWWNRMRPRRISQAQSCLMWLTSRRQRAATYSLQILPRTN